MMRNILLTLLTKNQKYFHLIKLLKSHRNFLRYCLVLLISLLFLFYLNYMISLVQAGLAYRMSLKEGFEDR
jgi:hypothetical protein